MRILLQLFTLSLLTTTIFSCKKKNEFLSDQNTAVIIGVLNPADSVHYIKVTRAFIGDGVTNSYDIAKISDSSYFAKTKVTIEEYSPNGSLLRTFSLHDTIVKDKNTSGAFYAPEQKVSVFYTQTNAPLNTDNKYKLITNIYKSVSTDINNPDIIIEAETDLTKGMTFASNLSGAFNFFTFANNPGEYKTQTFMLTSIGTAKRLLGEVSFDYYDYTNGGADSTFKKVNIPLGEFSLLEGTSNFSFYLPGNQFYQTLKDKIPASNTIDYRRCYNISVKVTGSNQILSNYIAINKPATSIAQNKPDFTNLRIVKGDKVKAIGIFASRSTVSIDKPFARTGFAQIQAIDRNSRRELCIGPLTGALRFCSWHQSDINSNFSWACN